MLVKVSLLAALASTLVSVVSASPVAETNAQRMARGLPPNPPSQFARGVTPVWAAKRTEPSSGPSTCYPGKIEVRYDFDGHVAGYVRNWENGGISGINFSGDPLEVKVCKIRSYTDRYDIIATNAAFKPPYYVGAGSGPVAGYLGTGNRSSVGFSNTPQTPPNAPPTLVNGNYYESAIWSYNSSTKELSPQWINPDGSKPSTVIAYDVRANGLFFVGDISQWNVSGFFASAVHFYLA